jgi:beta-glucanase (GH16 family)
MKRISFIIYHLSFSAALFVALQPLSAQEMTTDGYELVWHDEFDDDGPLNAADWTFEHGFVRNEEAQWYQEDNAFCKDGLLVIEGRREHFPNPQHGRARGWRNREFVDYTSACVTTNGLHSWTYGRFVVSARIPAFTGCWPAIWTLGQEDKGIYGWPNNGEIDLMEFYQVNGKPHILANACWGGARTKYDGTWSTTRTPFTHFLEKDPEWGNRFHVWRMDWTEEYISLYLDDELLNQVPLSKTVNPQTEFFPVEGYNPFTKPHYLLLNLALGGINGGSLADTPFPCRYEIDYVRVYQQAPR